MSGKRRAAGPAQKKPQRPAKRGSRWRRVLTWLLALGLVGSLLAVGAFVVLYQTIDVPDPNEDFETQTSFVYYNDGKSQIGTYATQNRESIPLDEMPDSIKDAVVAAENRSFWTDQGIDPRGILRAAFSNAQGNETQGASTITQQYVKILYLTQEQTLTRKIKEAIISLKLQRDVSKQEILEGYLNTIYFGRGAYGIQAAAKAYFDVEAKDLDVRQSAVLATVLNNPSGYDPANGKQARRDLQERYGYVLEGMAETGQISAAKADRAARRLPAFPDIEQESQYGGQRGHVLTMVRDELVRLGFDEDEIDGGGLRVTTTFTQKAMTAAQEGVSEVRPTGLPAAIPGEKGSTEPGSGDKDLHVGVASVEPGTGAVRGFYGGQDYLDSQINWAIAGGQAGSTMKPAALVAAIEDGFSLEDTFEGNSPFVLPDGTDFENQGDADYGSAVSMVTATENSINTAFIDMTMSMEDGPQKVVDAAERLGIPPAKAKKKDPGFPNTSPGLEPNTGVALGSATVSPINMANAYATIANGGRAAEPFIIEKVVDRNGETVYQHRVSDTEAVEQDIDRDVSYALQQVVQEGSGTAALALGRPAAGKTGTATNGEGAVSSAWFTGYTPQLSTSVMYVRGKGNEQLQGWLPEYFGGSYPAETWTAVMQRAMEGLPVEDFPPPANVDGDAPETGHEPYTPPPTTQAPPPRPTTKSPPSEEPTTKKPTEEPTTEEPTTEEPTTPTEEPDPCDRVVPPPSCDPEEDPQGGQGGSRDRAAAAAYTPAARERYVV
ncbi:transglycosylase domain-containing protein [Nocardioides sp. GXQ0305]|uniref:transglycosylase domain-containing protein n=1 Tax=Nocardioides sp. GXQ0305 TaxID=3423912 RepID=UPI003D7E068F